MAELRRLELLAHRLRPGSQSLYRLRIEVVVGEQRFPVVVPTAGGFVHPGPAAVSSAVAAVSGDRITVPLIRLAIARSGDKGDHANIGVAARRPDFLPYIRAALSEAAVADWFSQVLAAPGRVQRWDLPGSDSLNFLLHHALGGGGAASLRSDPQGKCYAQMLLEFPISLPAALLG